MKTIKTFLFLMLLVSFSVISNRASAQDPHFSFSNAFVEYQSPGLIGTQDNQMSFQMVYRNQWRNVGTAFQTYGLSGNSRVSKTTNTSFSVGGFIFNQSAFSYSSLLAHVAAAANVKLSEGKIMSVGIGSGTRYESLNPDDLMWTDQFNGYEYDPNIQHGEYFDRQQKASFDLSAGMSYKFMSEAPNIDRFSKTSGIISAGFWHLNQGKRLTLSDEQADIKMVFMTDLLFAMGQDKKAAFNPWVLGMLQGSAYELTAGGDFRFFLKQSDKYSVSRAIFSIGGAYRLNDAAMARIMFDYANYGIGVAYEMNTSSLKEASKGFGCFEVFLKYSPMTKSFSLY
ncbi:MAG TPA: PorP/SprF family type IX secretion system membrane protein [Bacteroidales bacterium]|nr:PorP/SprF family type IX secretion system membrane protein [Bacteroidales bacterium]